MQKIKLSPSLLYLAACLWLPMAAQAEECPSDDLSPICTDMRMQAQYEEADNQLNLSYKQLMKIMSQPAGQYIDFPALKSQFVEAQRQWLRFRDKECNAWYLINQAGAQRNADQMHCLINRTLERNQQLKEWIAQF